MGYKNPEDAKRYHRDYYQKNKVNVDRVKEIWAKKNRKKLRDMKRRNGNHVGSLIVLLRLT